MQSTDLVASDKNIEKVINFIEKRLKYIVGFVIVVVIVLINLPTVVKPNSLKVFVWVYVCACIREQARERKRTTYKQDNDVDFINF